MEHSKQIGQLTAALGMVQVELVYSAGGDDPFEHAGASELATVLRRVTPALNRYGLAVVQGFEPAPERYLKLATMVMHRSGQWLRSTALTPLAEETVDAFGAAATEARCLGLLTALGISDW